MLVIITSQLLVSGGLATQSAWHVIITCIKAQVEVAHLPAFCWPVPGNNCIIVACLKCTGAMPETVLEASLSLAWGVLEVSLWHHFSVIVLYCYYRTNKKMPTGAVCEVNFNETISTAQAYFSCT